MRRVSLSGSCKVGRQPRRSYLPTIRRWLLNRARLRSRTRYPRNCARKKAEEETRDDDETRGWFRFRSKLENLLPSPKMSSDVYSARSRTASFPIKEPKKDCSLEKDPRQGPNEISKPTTSSPPLPSFRSNPLNPKPKNAHSRFSPHSPLLTPFYHQLPISSPNPPTQLPSSRSLPNDVPPPTFLLLPSRPRLRSRWATPLLKRCLVRNPKSRTLSTRTITKDPPSMDPFTLGDSLFPSCSRGRGIRARAGRDRLRVQHPSMERA